MDSKVIHFMSKQFSNEQCPGTIVRDFETFLDFIGKEGVSVSSKTNSLPQKILGQLNDHLSHPISIRLKRPAQKSYPHINSLYLLLRASGLSSIKGKGTKQRLFLNEKVLTSWQELTLVERYYTLFETWLLRGHPEIISEDTGFKDMPFFNWQQFFKKIPDEGLQMAESRNTDYFMRYSPGSYNIALLELFGIISIDHGKPQEGGGWKIDRVYRTPFGNSLLNILSPTFKDFYNYYSTYIQAFEMPFGQLQPILKPYIPQWNQNLITEKHEFKDGIYIFKVSLPNVWRRIAIPASKSLDSLSGIILTSFDFDFDHLYQFSYKDNYGLMKEIYHPYMEDKPLLATEFRIGDLPLEPGRTITFLYDFGDMWKFKVELEEIKPPDPSIKKPRTIQEHGESPEQYYFEE